MGCCSPSPAPLEISMEEQAFSVREGVLGYGKHDVLSLFEELMRLEKNYRLSDAELSVFVQKCALKITEQALWKDATEGLYQRIKDTAGHYSARYLGVLIVLLSKGSLSDKAYCLYRLLPQDTQRLNRSRGSVRELIELMFEAACVWLPGLANTGSASAPGSLPQERVAGVVARLHENKEAAIRKAVDCVMDGCDEVSQTDFVMSFTYGKTRVLTNPHQFRRFVLTLHS